MFLENADNIVLLEGGRIVEQGKYSKIIAVEHEFIKNLR